MTVRSNEKLGDASSLDAKAETRRSWYFIVLAMSAFVFSFVDRQILALLVQPIKADLRITDTQFGLLQGLGFAAAYSMLGLPIASLSDRKPRPLIIGIGVICWSAATVACAFTRNFWQLFFTRTCVGAGEAALSPAVYSLMSDLFPPEKLGRAVAVFSFGAFIGSGIAFLVGGWVYGIVSEAGDFSFLGMVMRPWQAAFVIVGAPGILLGLLFWATVREPRLSAAASAPSYASVFAFMFSNWRIFAPHVLGFTAASMSLFTILAWAPALLTRKFALSTADVGMMLGVIALICGSAGVYASGWFMDWMSRKGIVESPFRAAIVGVAGALVAAVALAFCHTLSLALAPFCFMFFFASFAMPPSTVVMQMAAPSAIRSRVSAVYLATNSLAGYATGAFLVGALNDNVFTEPAGIGYSIPVVVAGASLLALLVLPTGVRAFRELVTANRRQA